MSDAWPPGDGGSTAIRIHRIPKTVAKQEIARDGQDNRQGGNKHPRVYEDAVQLLGILEEYPQLTAGGSMPSPRKLRVVSPRIEYGTARVATTMM